MMNVKEVLELCKKIGGTAHFIIEQESYQGKTPLDCVEAGPADNEEMGILNFLYKYIPKLFIVKIFHVYRRVKSSFLH